MAEKVFVQNRRATYDYEILETFEAGMMLTGAEVKSIRGGLANLKGSYVSVRANEAFVKNFHISHYQPKNQPGYNPTRDRKLLLNKKEIVHLENKTNQDGGTIIPLEIFQKNGVMKLKIGLGKARKKYDKREYLKKKGDMREIRQAVR